MELHLRRTLHTVGPDTDTFIASSIFEDISLRVTPGCLATKPSICDRIWENPPYGIRTPFAQCAFLVAQVEICQSSDFVIYMSNNPSSNCCRLLRRLVVLYEGEISLHFDQPSQPSCRTRSLLLWAILGILYLNTARFMKLLYVRSLFSFLSI